MLFRAGPKSKELIPCVASMPVQGTASLVTPLLVALEWARVMRLDSDTRDFQLALRLGTLSLPCLTWSWLLLVVRSFDRLLLVCNACLPILLSLPPSTSYSDTTDEPRGVDGYAHDLSVAPFQFVQAATNLNQRLLFVVLAFVKWCAMYDRRSISRPQRSIAYLSMSAVGTSETFSDRKKRGGIGSA